MGTRSRAVLMFLLPACAACGGADDAGGPGLPWSERDSAGVLVVENELVRIPADLWRVEDTPLLALGGIEAPESHQLFQISGATRLPDGRLAASSAGTHDVRVFNAEGDLLARYGGEGDGPEEFRDPTLMGRWGADTLVVFDATLSRISLLHPERGFLGSVPVSWSGKGFPIGRGLVGDGSILIGGGMSFRSEEGFPTGAIRPLSTFGWVGRDGREAVLLGDLPAAEMFARANEQGFMARSLPFGRRSVTAPAPQGAWIGTGETWEVRLHALDGRLVGVARVLADPRPVTAADRARYMEDELADAASDNEARQVRGILNEMPFPSAYPPYQSLLTDAEGRLWVQDYQGPGDERPTWTVLDERGRGVARVSTPPRTRVLEVGSDYLLGRTLDAMDVESLTLWRLRHDR